MGNCCGGNGDSPEKQAALQKFRGLMRIVAAKKELQRQRKQRLNNLFGTSSAASTKATTLNGAPSPQRTKKLGPFKLSTSEIDPQDGVPRYFYDQYLDVGDGKLYKGQWHKVSAKRDGVGVQFWPDGSKYEGMWRNDKANGRGRMTHSNGDVYEGEWKDDKACGRGIFIDANNAMYEGQWLDDLQHGEGLESWDGGKARYQGTFFKGKKNGKGRFEWEDGSYYHGDFVDGQF